MSNPKQENPVATLIAAINEQLSSTLAVGEFLFTAPERLSNHPSERNTCLVVVPYAISAWYGRIKVYYNRIHLSELGVIAVERTSETSVHPLIPKINALKGIFLTAATTEDTALPPKVGNDGKVVIPLSVLPNDLVFYGQSLLDSEGASPMPPVWPEVGTQVDTGCHGVALVGTLADGAGGFTEVVLDAESLFCGFVPEDGSTQLRFQDPASDNTDFVFDEPTS